MSDRLLQCLRSGDSLEQVAENEFAIVLDHRTNLYNVTIDVMGCHRVIAAQIVDQSGDYVLELKGNQGLLHGSVEDYFTVAQAGQHEGIDHSYRQDVDKGYGCLDVCRYWIIEDTSTLPQTEPWMHLRSIGMVERSCTEGGVTTVDKRYFC